MFSGYQHRYNRPKNSRPSFVKLHPEDDGRLLDNVFYEDPAKFIRQKNELGETHAWGLYDYHGGLPDSDWFGQGKREMWTQFMYVHDFDTPEIQFVKALMKKKESALSKLELGDLHRRDYILKIKLLDVPIEPRKMDHTFMKGSFGEDLIYRRFKVSGATNLDTLQDKIIQPIMGWTRNAHAYIFTDYKDGASYGPANANPIDMSSLRKRCHAYVAADKYTLAHLAQRKGVKFGYMYDLGDGWDHDVEVEDILTKENSNGAVEVLDGRGMCPPENGCGNGNFLKDLYHLKYGSQKQKSEVIEKIRLATNYRDPKITLSTFDPKAFSITKARTALTAALKSKSSVRTGMLKFQIPLTPGAGPTAFPGDPPLKRGQQRVNEYDSSLGVGGFASQTMSTRRDRLGKALCAGCGSPHNLKACSGCRRIFYCGADHQRADWKKHKAECKSAGTTKPKVLNMGDRLVNEKDGSLQDLPQKIAYLRL